MGVCISKCSTVDVAPSAQRRSRSLRRQDYAGCIVTSTNFFTQKDIQRAGTNNIKILAALDYHDAHLSIGQSLSHTGGQAAHLGGVMSAGVLPLATTHHIFPSCACRAPDYQTHFNQVFTQTIPEFLRQGGILVVPVDEAGKLRAGTKRSNLSAADKKELNRAFLTLQSEHQVHSSGRSWPSFTNPTAKS